MPYFLFAAVQNRFFRRVALLLCFTGGPLMAGDFRYTARQLLFAAIAAITVGCSARLGA